MAKLLNISIDVTKIDKSRLIEGKKGKYLKLTVAVNDEKDQYGNDVSAWQGQTQEEVSAKAQKNYLGNGRVFWMNDNITTSPQAQYQNNQATQAASQMNGEEDFPF